MHEPLIRVTIGRTFYDDHVSRDCREGQVVKQTKILVTVDLDPADFRDLYADAEHYVELGETYTDLRPLGQAALRVLARLDAAADAADIDPTNYGRAELAAAEATEDAVDVEPELPEPDPVPAGDVPLGTRVRLVGGAHDGLVVRIDTDQQGVSRKLLCLDRYYPGVGNAIERDRQVRL